MLGPGEIFILFFITLGPLKVFAPFAAQTRDLALPAARGIAVRVFVLSVVTVALAGFGGSALALKWKISLPALLIAGGIIFFVVALRLVLEQYEPAQPREQRPLPAQPIAAALQLTLPTVVTPYGIAALIALLAATQDSVRVEMIFGVVFGVMVLNLLAMLFARALMHPALLLPLRLVGAVLGVLQVALAVQIMLRALKELGLV